MKKIKLFICLMLIAGVVMKAPKVSAISDNMKVDNTTWIPVMTGSQLEIIKLLDNGDGIIMLATTDTDLAGDFTSAGFPKSDDGGDFDGIIAKYSYDGELIWLTRISGVGDDAFINVAKASDGFVIVGETTSTTMLVGTNTPDFTKDSNYHAPLIVKVNNSGEVQWIKSFTRSNTGSSQANTVAVGTDKMGYEAYYVGGYFEYEAAGNVYTDRGFIYQIDPATGYLFESSNFNSGEQVTVSSIATKDDVIAVTGYLVGSGQDFDEALGSYRGGDDAFVLLLSTTDLSVTNAKIFGSSGDESPFNIYFEGDSLYIFGATDGQDYDFVDGNGGFDGFAVKMNATTLAIEKTVMFGTEYDDIQMFVTKSSAGFVLNNITENEAELKFINKVMRVDNDLEVVEDFSLTSNGMIMVLSTVYANGSYYLSGMSVSTDGDIAVTMDQIQNGVFGFMVKISSTNPDNPGGNPGKLPDAGEKMISTFNLVTLVSTLGICYMLIKKRQDA